MKSTRINKAPFFWKINLKALLLSVNQGLENQNDENEIVYLDVDRDEVVTSWDAYRILVYSIGVIDEF